MNMRNIFFSVMLIFLVLACKNNSTLETVNQKPNIVFYYGR